MQVGGKENVDPAPRPKQQRKPRAKKVSVVLLNLSSSVSADVIAIVLFTMRQPLTFLTLFRCPVVALAGGFAPLAPSSGRDCSRGRGWSPMHTAPIQAYEGRPEAPEEGTTMDGGHRGGADYTETSKDVEIDDCDHTGVRIGGSEAIATDAHAGERRGKRIRTSSP